MVRYELVLISKIVILFNCLTLSCCNDRNIYSVRFLLTAPLGSLTLCTVSMIVSLWRWWRRSRSVVLAAARACLLAAQVVEARLQLGVGVREIGRAHV